MSGFSFATTPMIRCAPGAAGQLGALMADRVAPGAGLLFVTDPGVMRLGLASAALAGLRGAGFTVTVYEGVTPDPKAGSVLEAVALGRAAQVAGVIGFGGGSPMDVAKVAALLLGCDQPLEDAYGVGRAKGPRLPLALVPSTAGTGSEVTPVAILTTGEGADGAEKQGISSPLLLPDLAVLDADLTLGLPPAATAATGLDAMVHAIEAYTSRSPNANPLSRMLAVQALDLLAAHIRSAVRDGANRPARAAMLMGSMLAGQAFANAPVAAVHALAYPVGALFHVPHGLSNALVLTEVMRFNAPVCAAEYAALAPHLFPDRFARRADPAEGAGQVAGALIEALADLSRDIGLGPGLRSVGIGAGDLDRLADDAMKQTRLLVNNPRELTREDARAIYAAAL